MGKKSTPPLNSLIFKIVLLKPSLLLLLQSCQGVYMFRSSDFAPPGETQNNSSFSTKEFTGTQSGFKHHVKSAKTNWSGRAWENTKGEPC